jgi:hypothetical protein
MTRKENKFITEHLLCFIVSVTVISTYSWVLGYLLQQVGAGVRHSKRDRQKSLNAFDMYALAHLCDLRPLFPCLIFSDALDAFHQVTSISG